MEAIGRAAPGFAHAGRGRRSFFSFRKRAKEPKKKNLNGGDAWKPSGGPSPALRTPEGGGVLSFLSEKERKNQRKETLTGRGMHVAHRATLSRHTFTVFPGGADCRGTPRRRAMRIVSISAYQYLFIHMPDLYFPTGGGGGTMGTETRERGTPAARERGSGGAGGGRGTKAGNGGQKKWHGSHSREICITARVRLRCSRRSTASAR